MKRFFLGLAALAVTGAPAVASAQTPLVGRWKHGSMIVEIAPCGSHLCGTVVKASDKQQAKAQRGSGTELIGARLITGIERTGPNTYKGRVFAADRNMYASGTINQVSDNEVQVKGCVLLVICKSRSYQRVR